jgi:hypothetical protein
MFSIPTVGAAHQSAAIVFNECLLRLMHLRKHEVAAAGGDDNVSRIGWKLAVFQQGSLYRVVMLAHGGSSGWNNSNILSSILCSRALLETVAKLHYLQINLAKHVPERNIEAISTLLDKQVFATRDEEVIEEGAGRATNVITMIDKFDGAVPGVKQHYDFLSEWCHPNWIGQQFLFGTSDIAKRITTFSVSKGRNANTLDAIFGALMTITRFEKMLPELEGTAATIASSK